MPVRKCRRPALAAQSLADRILQCAGKPNVLGKNAGFTPRMHVFTPQLLREADMNMRISQLNGANTAGYFDRLPEKLVLEGYRRWTAGFETGSIIPWK